MILIFRSRICICFRHCVCILLSSWFDNYKFPGKFYSSKLYAIKYQWYPVDAMEDTFVDIVSDSKIRDKFQFYSIFNYEAASISEILDLQFMEFWTLLYSFFFFFFFFFCLQSVVFILWLLVIAPSPSSPAQRSSIHVTGGPSQTYRQAPSPTG